MDTTRVVKGLGAAVMVAFVGTASLGAGQASASGVATGLRYAAEPAPRPQRAQRPAADPANLPPASTLAVRYELRDGQLVEV